MHHNIRAAGYLQGNFEHYLDHLAPFCSLMSWPLIVTEEEIYKLAQQFYPDLCVNYWNPIEAPFQMTEQFDLVVTTLPRSAFDEIFFIAELFLGKRLKTLWLPHGNSDKGHLLPWMEALSAEENVLVYGPKMIDFLDSKKVLKTIKNVIPIGNFRHIYFQKHQKFYENLLDSMQLKSSFILYAPTWKDAENSSSFEAALEGVIQAFSKVPLVIKPHPNQAEEAYAVYGKLKAGGHLTWLDHFPPIYPLLARTSHLLGDFSSIGYDFLKFNRPMFFFNPSQRSKHDLGRFLHRCGESITVDELPMLFSEYSDQKELAALREQIYTYTFGKETSWELISHQLLTKVKQLDI